MSQIVIAYASVDSPGVYLGWGSLQIQLGNLIVIILMILLFLIALVLPFPGGKKRPGGKRRPPAAQVPPAAEEYRTWTGKARGWLLHRLPPDKLLPEDQPGYVASWIYVFGMAALVSLVFILVSGAVLGLNGPSWYHVSGLGHFVNSVHLWSVELFFMTMVVHLWGKYWMAAWRGGRVLTWITGVLAFLVSIVTAFTGYLLQTNFDSQWIAFEGKDALNSAGIGAWFNVANVGQMFMWHIILLPVAVGAVVAVHVLLVRVHGVVPPLEADQGDAQLRSAGAEERGSRR